MSTFAIFDQGGKLVAAAALLTMSQVFGPCYEVEADELTDQEKVREKWPKEQFIFASQTPRWWKKSKGPLGDLKRSWHESCSTGEPPRCGSRRRHHAGRLTIWETRS